MIGQHRASVDRLLATDPQEELSIRSVVSACLAAGGMSTSRWAVERRWDVLDDRLSYTAVLHCTVTSGGTESSSAFVLPILCDETARRLADDEIQIGDHDGIYLDGPYVPQAQLVVRPGLHVVWRSGRVSLDPTAPVTPPLTPTILLRADVGRGLLAGPRQLTSLAHEALQDDPWRATLQRLRAGVGITEAGYFTAATTEAVLAEAAGAESLGDLLAGDIGRPPVPTAWPAAQRFSAANAHLRYYGDLLLDHLYAVVVRCVKEQVGRLQAAGVHQRVGPALTRAVADATPRLRRRTGLLDRDDHTDTLACAERRRAITLFGPGGLPSPARGQIDFRELHPDWRGRICPLQTPESERIGLIRYAALGATDHRQPGLEQWDDVSLSAALIPYLNHNEQARAILAAKNLKQAVPLATPERPLVGTGVEHLLGSSAVARTSIPGRVHSVAPGRVVIAGSHSDVTIRFGPAGPRRAGPLLDWRVVVAEGDQVAAGDLLAHAPDVVIGDDGPGLALGVNFIAALTPWHGLNFEDAIVVSDTAAQRLAHQARVEIRDDLPPGSFGLALVEAGEIVEAGQRLAAVHRASAHTYTITAPQAGRVEHIGPDVERGRFSIIMVVRDKLQVGDKLTNRHGGKGVVSRIVPEGEMPIAHGLGRPVDMIVNPLGVLRRLNIGQVLEMAAGLHSLLRGEGPVRAGRRMTDRAHLASELQALGAPNGQLPLFDRAGRPLVGGQAVTVGPQYVVKLTHTARSKLSVRCDGPTSRWRQQPSSTASLRDGTTVGSAQRLGEMELWALQAVGATDVVESALRGGPAKAAPPDTDEPDSERATWISVVAHLGAAGYTVRTQGTGRGRRVQLAPSSPADLTALHPFSDAELQRVAQDERAGWPSGGESVHPLYDLLHGVGDERRCLRRCLDLRPLDVDLAHPWTGEPLTMLPILPPAYRSPQRDELDPLYLRIACLIAPPTPGKAGWRAAPEQVVELRELIAQLFGCWAQKGRAPRDTGLYRRLSGKRGLLRRYLLGVSQNSSGRGVIIPQPSLPIEEVDLPPRLFEALVGDSSDRVVIINRQPTLRPANLIALQARRGERYAVGLHPSLLHALAGDFDGDTVAVHRLSSSAARRQAWDRLRPSATLTDPANGRPMIKSDLDLALGWRLAPTPASGASAASRLAALAAGPDACSAIAAEQRRLWDAATGWSVGLMDLQVLGTDQGDQWLIAGLNDDPRSGPLVELLEAGALPLRAVGRLLAKGGEAERSLNPLLPPAGVRGCFLDGLGNEEFFDGARPAMARLAEKKLLTPQAGALTKSLVEIAYEVVVSSPECGAVATELSPLTCGSPDPCQRCYGPLPGSGHPPAVGSRVGILAGMVIGERSTQLAMKTFHVGRGAPLDVPELRALLGHGRSRSLAMLDQADPIDRGPVSLSTYLQRLPAADAGSLKAVQQLIVTGLDGAVVGVHVAVILRQLYEAWADASGGADRAGSLAQRAERRGRDPLVAASSRGALRTAVTGDGAVEPRQAERLALMTGIRS